MVTFRFISIVYLGKMCLVRLMYNIDYCVCKFVCPIRRVRPLLDQLYLFCKKLMLLCFMICWSVFIFAVVFSYLAFCVPLCRCGLWFVEVFSYLLSCFMICCCVFLFAVFLFVLSLEPEKVKSRSRNFSYNQKRELTEQRLQHQPVLS